MADTPQSTDPDELVEKGYEAGAVGVRKWRGGGDGQDNADLARAAIDAYRAVVERERPSLTEELEFLREQLELKDSASVDRVLRALQDRDKEFDRAEAAEAKLAEAQLELARERSVVQRLDYGLAEAQKDMDRALIARDQARAYAQQLRSAIASSTTERPPLTEERLAAAMRKAWQGADGNLDYSDHAREVLAAIASSTTEELPRKAPTVIDTGQMDV